MAKSRRMINCDFVNASSFKLKLSNRAKLLYFYMSVKADDKGFVDNTDELIEILDSNDRKFESESSYTLLPNSFETAIHELIERGLVYSFQDNHLNNIYLVKHWYVHNLIPKDRVRNSSYEKYLENYIINNDGEYIVSQVYDKCDTDDIQMCTQNKLNKNKVKESKINKQINNKINNSCEVIIIDYSVIPDKWEYEDVSNAVALYCRKRKGEQLTEQEEKYLSAWLEASKRESDKN